MIKWVKSSFENREYFWDNKDESGLEDEIQVKELLLAFKDNEPVLVPHDTCIKTYSWNQFVGLENLILYCSELKEFNSHEWVKFYEDIEGQPNVQWKEGCHDTGLEELKDFEQRVEDKYGEDKEDIVYRTYMLEADKLRLALNLPARTIGIGGTVIKVCNFKNLLEEMKDQINKWITEIASTLTNEYIPKNMLWLLASKTASVEDFQYLKGEGSYDGDIYYYDLVTVYYLGHNYAIPTPILAKILDVKEEYIKECFSSYLNRYEEEENENYI